MQSLNKCLTSLGALLGKDDATLRQVRMLLLAACEGDSGVSYPALESALGVRTNKITDNTGWLIEKDILKRDKVGTVSYLYITTAGLDLLQQALKT